MGEGTWEHKGRLTGGRTGWGAGREGESRNIRGYDSEGGDFPSLGREEWEREEEEWRGMERRGQEEELEEGVEAGRDWLLLVLLLWVLLPTSLGTEL